MSDWHPIVWKVGKINTVPNSDFLEITTVMNEYPVVFKTGQFKQGDLAAFLPYDTVVPDTKQFYFLAPKEKVDKTGNVVRPKPKVGEVPIEYRTIKSKRLRGTYSEGLLVECPPGLKEGDSVVEYFGLTKRVYEEEVEEQINQNKYKQSIQHEKGPFQFPKYDLDGLAKYGHAFNEGEEVLICEKLEGQWYGVVYTKGRLWVRSRRYWKGNEFPRKYYRNPLVRWFMNLYLTALSYITPLFIKQLNVSNSEWWDIPIAQGFKAKLKKYPGLMVCGEWYGNVPKFSYDCKTINNELIRKFRVFDIWDSSTQKFLEWVDVLKIANELEFETVPVLYKGPWKTDRSLHVLAEGKSTLSDSHPREGFVMRSIPESTHPSLGRKIIKLKGRDYKLSKG